MSIEAQRAKEQSHSGMDGAQTPRGIPEIEEVSDPLIICF